MHLHGRQIRCSESWIGNHHRPILVAPPNKSTTCHAYRTATWIFFHCEKSGRQPQWCKHFGLESSPEGQTCTYNTEVRSDNMDPEDDPWKFTLLKPNIGASSRCRKKYDSFNIGNLGSTKPHLNHAMTKWSVLSAHTHFEGNVPNNKSRKRHVTQRQE